jgi:hypothetical protein
MILSPTDMELVKPTAVPPSASPVTYPSIDSEYSVTNIVARVGVNINDAVERMTEGICLNK